MKTTLEILAAGEYDYHVTNENLFMSATSGLWLGSSMINISKNETIHGNALTISVSWIQIGATGKVVTEELTFHAHGRSTKVTVIV